jgi:hypothetical protein
MATRGRGGFSRAVAVVVCMVATTLVATIVVISHINNRTSSLPTNCVEEQTISYLSATRDLTPPTWERKEGSMPQHLMGWTQTGMPTPVEQIM